MNKYVKWTGIAILLPLILLVILGILLYFPPFQRWAVKQATEYASSKTGMEISIDRMTLEFPLNLGLNGFKMIKQNDSLPQVKDTVADVGILVVHVQLLPLLNQKIEIKTLEFNEMKLNTFNLVHSLRIQGKIGRLALQNNGDINWGRQLVNASELQLSDARIDLALSDTVPPDTTKSTSNWMISVDRMKFKNTDFTLHMLNDSLQVRTYFGNALAQNANLDLGKAIYNIAYIDWKQGHVNYDKNFTVHSRSLYPDMNHLELEDLNLHGESFHYDKSSIRISLIRSSFKERSGIIVSDLSGVFNLDSKRLSLPSLKLVTPKSSIIAQVGMDLNTFDKNRPGQLKIKVNASIGKQDLMRFFGDLPISFRRQWPDNQLQLSGLLQGNMQKVNFKDINVKLPTAFNVNANGFMGNVTDIKHLKGEINLNANTFNCGFLTSLIDSKFSKQIRIPHHIGFQGNLKINGDRFNTAFKASEGGGILVGKAKMDLSRMKYDAHIVATNFKLNHFLPGRGLNDFSGAIQAQGKGIDWLSSQTKIQAKAQIRKFRFGKYDLDGVNAEVSLLKGHAYANIHSKNQLMDGVIKIDALTSRKDLSATIVCDVANADLYKLHLVDQPISVSLCGHLDLQSNLKENYKIIGTIGDLTFTDSAQTYRPEDIVLDLFTRRDTTHAVVDCGDFHLNMNARGGYNRLMAESQNLMMELRKQFNDKYIDQVRIRERLPLGKIYLSSGKENFFIRLLKRYNFELSNVLVDLDSSPIQGINGKALINKLNYSGVQLDTIRLNVKSNSDRMSYTGQIQNNKKNPQYVFNALFDGAINERGAYVNTNVYDSENKLGFRLGINGEMEIGGIRLHMTGHDPILGYKKFVVNDSNYVFFGDDSRISANLKLLAKDGMGVQVYSNDANHEVLQDITISLNKFDLKKALSVIPYTPDIAGEMNGDFHLIKTSKELSVSSDMNFKNFYYNKSPMGDLGVELVYMPKEGNVHFVDGILKQNNNEVATLTGTYESRNGGIIDAEVGLERMSMALLNGFIPQQIIGFRGFMEGNLKIQGSLSKPQVDGEAYLDSAYLISIPYGFNMRFANDPVRIVGSRLLFENFEVFANNDSPLNVSGNLNFSDFRQMSMDVKMQAQNFELIDAKENSRSEAYGHAFVDFYGRMRGKLDNLQMRGRLNVLGNTDITYVVRNSELSTDTQLNELVQFTDFKDTTVTVMNRPPLTGFDMVLGMNIDESAHILCMLNSEHTNYIDLIGGGNLSLTYNSVDNLKLNGRYTLNNGEMKYSLPVIPLKTFNIQDGSYLEFQGDPFDPLLHITATETVKSTVHEGTNTGRLVEFNSGVKLTKTLAKPGVEFIIEAPNDMTIQDELNTMTVEGRAKVAVTMLASGMYLVDGNTNSFSMNNALSSFLQHEINNVTGTALHSMGLDLGMSVDNTVGSNGTMHTDYNFSFAKRLWNNRLSVIVGGKVSSGSQIDESERNSFLNNVELEYRMDDKSSKYLRLFFNNSAYDWLEGRIGEYGVGFMWRRKLDSFKDIFSFKDSENVLKQMDKIDNKPVKNEK